MVLFRQYLLLIIMSELEMCRLEDMDSWQIENLFFSNE